MSDSLLQRGFSRISYILNHPANRGARLRALGRTAVWQLHKRLIAKPWDAVLLGDRKVRCYLDLHCASLLVSAGLYDYEEMRFLLRYLREDDHFLDIGANVGVYSILASTVITGGTIHAFEPSSLSRQRLEENLRINRIGNVEIHAAAAGERGGTVRISCGKESMNHLFMSGADGPFEEVSQVRLDDAVGEVAFAAGKIDVEGAELPAFRGAVGMLESHNPPVWIFEVGDASRNFGYGPGDLVNYLGGFGYRPAEVDLDAGTVRLGGESWRRKANITVVAEDKKEEIERKLQRP